MAMDDGPGPPPDSRAGPNAEPVAGTTYRSAGVDLDAAARAVEQIRPAVVSTHHRHVLAGFGGFAGMLDVAAFAEVEDPVLVASTDGIGTKALLASTLGHFNALGLDVVHHCANDVLCHGARPLFFLDYIGCTDLDPRTAAEIVDGCAAACRALDCALLGGELAEMPNVYQPEAIEVIGTMVGVAGRADLVTGAAIAPGDAILALPSSGLHTNGFTLARTVLARADLHQFVPELGRSLGDALLIPHRAYVSEIQTLRQAGVPIRGLVHVTGGGIAGNTSRILPPSCAAVIHRWTWAPSPIFELIRRLGPVPMAEMFRVFNMGVGMLAIVPADTAVDGLRALGPQSGAWRIGEVIARDAGEAVVFVD